MESGLFVQVFTSAEVIAASLFLILLLPLVFYIASTRSRRKFVRKPAPKRPRRVKPAKPAAEQQKPVEEADDLDSLPGQRPRSRGPAAGPEDLK
jgi:hypothetical protein